MARFDGRGMLKPYSCEILLAEPVRVCDLNTILGLPENFGSNLIAVRGSRKLDMHDLIYNNEEIMLFIAVMGG
ncbi:MAG: hypothetical protein K0Q99_594 [Clostridia bacterium]|jgi:hypothetical protein|nr:hypothetical protein [Clostridia bacterium]